MFVRCERWHPYIIALTASVICYWFDPTPPKSTVALLAAIISMASIAVGFLAATLAIVLSSDDIRIIKHLRQVGGYDLLLQYLREAIGLSFALGGLCTVGLFKDFETSHWPRIAEAAWVFIAISATLSYVRVTRVFFKILSSPR